MVLVIDARIEVSILFGEVQPLIFHRKSYLVAFNIKEDHSFITEKPCIGS